MTFKNVLMSRAGWTAIGIAVLATGQTASAQNAAADDEKEIVVTGSLIRGTPEDAALPIDVIGAEELSKQGAPSTLELIKALPVSNGVLGDSNQFDSRSQGSEGIATVNLRGLGPGRTLVLLNSRRLVPAGNGVPAVDINLIPTAAIGRVEVLKDGAAATYGSDAIGGVVNFITRTNQDGFLASADYKFVRGSKGDYNGAVSFGRQTDNFRFLAAIGYQHRSELFTTDRDFALRPYTQNPEGGWTGGGNPGSFLFFGVGIPAAQNPVRADPDCAVLGGFVTAINRCSTQFTGFDALVETEDRAQAFVDAEGDLSDTVKLRVNALFGYSEVPHYRTSPSYLLTQSPSASVGGSTSGFIVPATNPGYIQFAAENPAILAAVPGTKLGVLFPTLLFRPYLVGGNPAFTSGPGDRGSADGRRESVSMRLSSDLTVNLTDSLDLTLSGTYHKYDRYIDGYDSFGDRVQLALRGLGGPNCNPATGTPGVGPCMWLNPFGNAVPGNAITGADNPGPEVNVNTAELTNWFFVKSTSRAVTSLFVADAAIAGGTGINLPGGEVKFAIGAQYRKNKYAIHYGANNNIAVNPCKDTPVNGNTACSPQNGALAFLGTNQDAGFSSNVKAAFTEVQAPIFDGLNLQLAARYEKYNGAVGSTFDPKATLRWQATDWFALRGSIGTTFRGPPAQFVSAGKVTSLQVIASSFRPVDTFGNLNLSPESATNYSAGAVINVGSFTATLDYFHYKVKDSIVVEPLSGIVAAMFAGQSTNTALAAPNCSNPAYAGLLSRFTFNGLCRDANISRVRIGYINGASIKTSGLDLILNYRNNDVFGGELAMGATATYVINYRTADQLVEGINVQPGFDGVGLLNFQTTAYPLPEWKGQYFVEYGRGIFTGRFTFNYVDGYTDQRTAPFVARADIPGNPVLGQGKHIHSYATADFNLQIKPWESTTINLTVNNLTDRDPSFARLEYNYDPFTGNPVGRSFKIGVSQKF